MHRVALAQVVGLDHGGLVDGLFALQDASAAEAVEHQGEVQRRRDVLGGEEVQVVGLLVAVGEQGAVVGEFSVGDLGVVVRQRAVGVAPGLLRVIELHALVAAAQEPVVVLDRRAGHAKPAGVDVLTVEGVVVEVVVVGGVRDVGGHLAEVRVARPGHDALIVERVGQGVGLQDARGGLDQGIADVLALLTDLGERVHPGQFELALALQVVGAALFGRERGVPGLEGGLGPGGRIHDPQGVEFAPERGVELRLEGVARAQPLHRVGGRCERERVREVRGGGVLDGDLLQREGTAQLVPAPGVHHRVRRVYACGDGERRGIRPPGRLRSREKDPRGGEGRHGDRKQYARKKAHNQTKIRTFGGFSKSA